MAMVGARLSPVAMIYRVDTTQGLAVNQWLQVQLGSLGQEGFVAEVVKREQRRKVLTSTREARDSRRHYPYTGLTLANISNRCWQRPTQAEQVLLTGRAYKHRPIGQMAHVQ